jgi:hypothetical protein
MAILEEQSAARKRVVCGCKKKINSKCSSAKHRTRTYGVQRKEQTAKGSVCIKINNDTTMCNCNHLCDYTRRPDTDSSWSYRIIQRSQFTSSKRFKVLQYTMFYKIMSFSIQNTKVLLFAALYGYDKWFLTLREEHKLQAFENKTGNLRET